MVAYSPLHFVEPWRQTQPGNSVMNESAQRSVVDDLRISFV
jgi:hypothetical protein